MQARIIRRRVSRRSSIDLASSANTIGRLLDFSPATTNARTEAGNTIGSWTFHVDRYIDPVVQSSQMLVSKPPSGSNVKGARATAYWIEIDNASKSAILNL